MHGIWKAIGSFVRRADMVLLSLCIAASVFGIVVISSATNVKGSAQFVRTQTLALILGVILYVVFTLIDVDIIAERRELLLIFSAIFILLLFPFGDTRSGNRSWLAFSFLPFSICTRCIAVYRYKQTIVLSIFLAYSISSIYSCC